jgi:hypothetical protein
LYQTWFISYRPGVADGAGYGYLGLIGPDGAVRRTSTSKFAEDSLALTVARWAVRLAWEGSPDPADATVRLVAGPPEGPIAGGEVVTHEAADGADGDDEAEDCGPVCPVCRTAVDDDLCKHVVLTLTGDGGH